MVWASMRLSAVLRQEGSQWTGWNPELDIASQGRTEPEALANLREAVELYLEDEDATAPHRTTLTTFEVKYGSPAGAFGT